jgi:hypothetical protein
VFGVPGHYNLTVKLARVRLRGVECDDIAIVDQRTHRRAFYAQATGFGGIRAPHRRCSDHFIRGELPEVDMVVALLPASSRMDGKNGNCDQVYLFLDRRSFPPASRNNNLEIRKPGLMQHTRAFREGTTDIRGAQAGPGPEPPAFRFA